MGDETTSGSHKLRAEPPNWCEIGIFVAEIVGIIGLAIYCWLNWKEWKTFDSERQTMQDEMRNDERAWVAVRQAAIRGNIFPNIAFEIMFKNTGKTPAINLSVFMSQSTSTNSIPKTDKPAYPANVLENSQFPGLLAPDAEQTISVGSLFLGMGTPDEQSISRGTKPYYVYGTIWYDDIFGKHHWSQFCYAIRVTPDADSAAEFLPINIHNTCDDAQTNQSN